MARALWTVAAVAGCGRLGFDSHAAGGQDGPAVDSPRPADGPGSDAPAGSPRLGTVTDLQVTSTCGGANDSIQVPISNLGTADLIITDAQFTNGFGTTVPISLPLQIPPGQLVRIDVVGPAAVIGTDLGGSVKTGTLTLVSNDPAGPTVVPLADLVIGANVALDQGGSAVTSIALVASGGACPATQFVALLNTGNADATVVFGGESDLVLASFTSGTLGSGSSSSASVRAFTQSACVETGTVTFTVTGNVCTETPLVLQGNVNITGASSCFCS